jgi:hypothetical protein
MATSLFAVDALFTPLQQLARWVGGLLLTGAPARVAPAARTVSVTRVAPVATATARRPLRVVRLVEGSQPPASAGRMVISGRMADVCAELERLAALEAAAS